VPATLTPGFWLFDNPLTRKFTEDRMEFITPLLRQLRKSLRIDSALDVGCGLGDFSGFLSQFGIPKALTGAQRILPKHKNDTLVHCFR
jgi:hypothetical protein